jgi:WD40 repeat protein
MLEEKRPPSPFKGLVPFSEEDAPFFFGRENETRIICANLRTRPLTLLYGPTGVGKSSLLNAGVLPALHELNEQLKLDSPAVLIEDSDRDFNLFHGASRTESVDDYDPIIVIIFSKWLDDPLAGLKEQILKSLTASSPRFFTPEDAERLRPLPLRQMLIAVSEFPRVLELLIILDQFEQYFVNHPFDEEFATDFCLAVSSPSVRANFLISIREDWLARLDRFKRRIPNIFGNSIRIKHLDPESAEAAIRGPIRVFDEMREKSREEPNLTQKIIIEDDFVKEIIRQLARLDESGEPDVSRATGDSETEPQAQFIKASGLQIVLRNLWTKIKNKQPPSFDLELVKDPKTAQRIIQTNLQRVLDKLSNKEQLIAANFFRFLITTSGTKLAETANGLASQSRQRTQKVKPLLKKLCGPDFRILSETAPPPNESQQVRYELTTDALARPIRKWVREILAKRDRQVVVSRFVAGIVALLAILFVVYGYLNARHRQQAAEERQRILTEEGAKTQRAYDAVKRLDTLVPFSKAVLRGHGERVTSAVFTSDGHVLTASADGSAILWDVETSKPFREFSKNSRGLVCATVNPKGDRIVTASVDGSVILYNLQTNETEQLRGPVGKHVTSMSFNRDGTLIAGANTVGDVIMWSVASRAPVKEISGGGKPIRQLVFSPTGNLLAAASDDASVRIWRSPDWQQTNNLLGHTDRVNSVAFSPDEKSIATGSADTTVRIWSLPAGSSTRVLIGHEKSINSVDFSDDGLRLLSASDDTTARIWDIKTSKYKPLVGHTDAVISASFSPKSDRVVTAGKDGVVRIWSSQSGKTLVELRGHVVAATYVTYSSDGQYVLTAGDDATARVWFANEFGSLIIDPPVIEAKPNYHPGACPVVISFPVSITATGGSGVVIYRFRGSDGRIWPESKLPFDGPGTQYLNWYWRINQDYSGSEIIEIIEPKGIKPQTAHFTVKCTRPETTASPTEPSLTNTPAASPSP